MPGSDVKGKKMGGWRMKNRGEDSSGPHWWERAQERNAPRELGPEPHQVWSPPTYSHPFQALQDRRVTETFWRCHRGQSTLLRSWLIQGSGMGEVIHRAAWSVWSPRTLRGHAVCSPHLLKSVVHLQSDQILVLLTPRREKTLSVSPGSLPTFLAVASYLPSPVSVHSAAVPDLASPPLFSMTRESLLWGGRPRLFLRIPPSDNPSPSGGPGPKESPCPSPSPPPAVLLGMFPVASRAELQPRQLMHARTGAREKKGERSRKGHDRGTEIRGDRAWGRPGARRTKRGRQGGPHRSRGLPRRRPRPCGP